MTTRPENKLIDIASYRLFIFDLDGTLYDQKKLRKTISLHLFLRFLTMRAGIMELRIIDTFRKEREKHKGYASATLNDDQFNWCATVLNIHPDFVRKTITYWMYQFPLPYLLKERFKGIAELFGILKQHGKDIVIYSDFPGEDKMKALKLAADRIFCSTDPEIAHLKPGRRGLEWICKAMNIAPDQALFIGDRDDTDGESARQAGIDYLIINREQAVSGVFYQQLINQFRSYHAQH